jgi:antitoxin component YwqK of YwqJK toxin-antitoxin module
MKIGMLIYVLCSAAVNISCAQEKQIIVKDSVQMYSMNQTVVKYNDGQKYYLKGSDEPYTGFLYAKYDNGKMLSVQQLVNGLGNGIWINYDPEGNKECQGTYVDNRIEGPITFYYEDGSVKSVGQYREWKRPIGLWKYYDRKGNIVSTLTYTR